MFGIGALLRISEEILREREDVEDQDLDGVSGRLARLHSGVGRLGWKATFATADDAVAAAFINELGLTTSRHPHDGIAQTDAAPEVDDARWRAVSSFVASLAPPSTDYASELGGFNVFRRIGCEKCHRCALMVGRDVNGRSEMTPLYPYTDLLLHDMGPALADGISEGDASIDGGQRRQHVVELIAGELHGDDLVAGGSA